MALDRSLFLFEKNLDLTYFTTYIYIYTDVDGDEDRRKAWAISYLAVNHLMVWPNSAVLLVGVGEGGTEPQLLDRKHCL